MSTVTKNLAELVKLLEPVPLGTYFSITAEGGIEFQADGHDKVKGIRAVFPGLIWRKRHVDSVGWWEYTTKTPDGIKLRIYGDKRGPPSCKRIEETYEEVIHIPACEEHDEVHTRTRVRWECPEEEKEAV